MKHYHLLITGLLMGQLAVAQDHPNVILVLVDDLGFGDVSSYNEDSKIITPNIDRLASEGIRFTDAHTSASQCSPSRYSLLTGRYPWRTRLKAIVLPHFDKPLIEKERLTIASQFKMHGYKTACIGKWHLGMGWQTKEGHDLNPRSWDVDQNLIIDYNKPLTESPNDNGFDYYFGISGSNNMLPYCLIENNRVVTIPDTPKYPIYDTELEGGLIAADYDSQQLEQILLSKVLEWLNQHVNSNSEDPFFMYYPMSAIHKPCLPVEPFIKTSQAGLRGDKIKEVDDIVGTLIDWVDEKGIADNTMFIFTSDNGADPGDSRRVLRELAAADYGQIYAPGYWIQKDNLLFEQNPIEMPVGSQSNHTYQHFSSGPFKGYKSDIFEGGHRVPLIIRWPDSSIQPGSSADELVCLMDFLATFADMFESDLPVNAGEDSFSFYPLLTSNNNFIPRKNLVHQAWRRNTQAIRSGDWKLIPYKGSGSNRTFPEVDAEGQLYNMSDDPYETTNLYDKYPNIVEELTNILNDIIHEHPND